MSAVVPFDVGCWTGSRSEERAGGGLLGDGRSGVEIADLMQLPARWRMQAPVNNLWHGMARGGTSPATKSGPGQALRSR